MAIYRYDNLTVSPQPFLKKGNDLGPKKYGQGPFYHKIDEEDDNSFFAVFFVAIFK